MAVGLLPHLLLMPGQQQQPELSCLQQMRSSGTQRNDKL
jgi:hypothetical protein